jgi:N-acetylglucosamine-6-phosphate deacetylase
MSGQTVSGCILTSDGFVRGTLHWQAGRITAIQGNSIDASTAQTCGEPIVLPGFIDLHVHGGGGADVMQGGAATATIARTHACHGTTALLATTMTAPLDEVQHALHGASSLIQQRGANQARVLGIHLEGPYISPDKLGAQPPCTRPHSLAEVQLLDQIAAVKLITIAPELPQSIELIVALRAQGFAVQIGHTAASYEQTCAALAAGASGFTHLFNAMSGLHHRAPGAVGAALAHARYAELIVDLEHVHPGAIRTALRAIPHVYCVTDSTAATGMPDGEYALGRHQVRKCGNGVRLPDGTLAGSTLTLDVALRNLVGLGVALDDAALRVSTYPARFLGLQDRGQLVVGAHADVTVLDPQLGVQQVWVEGEQINLEC